MVTQVDFLSQTFSQVTGGQVGTAPAFFVASSDQTAAVITTAGAISHLYTAKVVKAGDIIWVNGDQDGTPFQNVYTVTATSGGSLVPYTEAVGGVLLAANNLSDVNDAAASRHNLGLGSADSPTFNNVNLGSPGVPGDLFIYPNTASHGHIIIGAVDASGGDFNITIVNAAVGQSTTLTIPNVANSVGSFLMCNLGVSDIASNLIGFDVTVAFSDMSGGTSKTLYTSGGSRQYKIVSLFANRGGTNFSGGGGDRLGAITDNTTVYSVIPAASLQTLANARWGDTALPFPASAAINTSTAAAASLVMKYSGGTADYTAGSVVISGIVKRVA